MPFLNTGAVTTVAKTYLTQETKLGFGVRCVFELLDCNNLQAIPLGLEHLQSIIIEQ